jgi:hypothetical protein
MNTTDDMSGLSSGFSWTHKSATWMQSKTSSGSQVSMIHDSGNSSVFSSFHIFHAWRKTTIYKYVILFINLQKGFWDMILLETKLEINNVCTHIDCEAREAHCVNI